MDEKLTCGQLMKFITCSIEKEMNAQLREHDLTAGQGALLKMLIDHGEPVPMKELEKWLHISQPTVVGLVKRCESKGLVKTSGKPGDKRVKLVEVTDKGMTISKETYNSIKQVQDQLTGGLSEKEAEVLEILLRKVCTNFEGDPEHFRPGPPFKHPPVGLHGKHGKED